MVLEQRKAQEKETKRRKVELEQQPKRLAKRRKVELQ